MERKEGATDSLRDVDFPFAPCLGFLNYAPVLPTMR